MSTIPGMARAFALFSAAYPSSRKVDEGTIRVWVDATERLSDDVIEVAARRWIRSEPRFPNLAAFTDTVRELIPRREGPSPRPICALCIDGWIETSTEGYHGTVTRCPNGCKPSPMGDLLELSDDTASPAVFDAARAVISELRPSRPKPVPAPNEDPFRPVADTRPLEEAE